MKFGGLLRVLGLNAVPIGGVVFGGWLPATGLALYWCENVLGTAANALRISLHRRWTGKRGHLRGQLGVEVNSGHREPSRRPAPGKTKWKSFLAEYLTGSLVFTLAHGLFLAMILLGIFKTVPAKDEMLYGLAGIALFQAGGLASDLLSLRDWPFARLKDQIQRSMGRVVLVHVAIIFGMGAFAWFERPGAFFWVFGGLKTMSDIGGLVAARKAAAAGVADPARAAEPPAWANRLVRLLAPAKGRNPEEFAVQWRRERERELAEAARDEESVDRGAPGRRGAR